MPPRQWSLRITVTSRSRPGAAAVPLRFTCKRGQTHNTTPNANIHKRKAAKARFDMDPILPETHVTHLHHCNQLHSRVAPDLHCYGRIGKKNLRGWIKGNTLCKLPWPEALGLHTPWHPLSFTSCLHASNRAKTVKNWMSESTALLTKKKKERCPWLRRCCLAWGQQLHHSRPTHLACGSLWNFYKIQTFLLLFHFKRLIWAIKILKLGRCCFRASNWIFGASWPWHTVYRDEYCGLLKGLFSPTPQSVSENPDRATSAVNHKLIIWQETKG